MKFPSSLLVRTNFVLALSAAAMAATSILALAMFVIRPIQDRAADDEAGLMMLSAKTWVELAPEARLYFALEMLQEYDLTILEEPRRLPAADPDDHYYTLLASKLSARLDEPVELMESDDLVWADIPAGGTVLQIGISPERDATQPLYVIVSVVLIGALIVFATSARIVSRVAGPLSQAASAVEAFRGIEPSAPLPEKGPAELVTLARSFNAMARNVSELLSNRTTLLAGISHDLRTPLTRMRFTLELLPDNVAPALTERFERNLTAMEALISNALRFARGTREDAETLDFDDYLAAVVKGIADDVPVRLPSAPIGHVVLAAGAFQRVLANLVTNARQHAGSAEVAAETDGDDLVVHVIDHGAGIPSAERERVFQPFYRLDGARRQTTGGSGLGLAIVKQLCETHGWAIALKPAAGGGTDMQVRIRRGHASAGGLASEHAEVI